MFHSVIFRAVHLPANILYVKLVFFFPISGSLWEKMFKLEIEIEGRKIGSKHTIGAHRRGWVGWKGVRFETFCHITAKIRNHLDSLAIPSTPLKRNQGRPGFPTTVHLWKQTKFKNWRQRRIVNIILSILAQINYRNVFEFLGFHYSYFWNVIF